VSNSGIAPHSEEDLKPLLAGGEGFVWVDLAECDERATRLLTDVFGFQAPAVHDCRQRNFVPKGYAYADHRFLARPKRARTSSVFRHTGGTRRRKKLEVDPRYLRWVMIEPGVGDGLRAEVAGLASAEVAPAEADQAGGRQRGRDGRQPEQGRGGRLGRPVDVGER
jgi:hypothetical protein